ncbi:MAG: cell division protein ZapA [Acidobacteria bacterium]|nr:cell division protein ZapA [Acidobacteriota bacterium]
MSANTRVVTVEIGGQRYPIRSTLDAAYVAELAAYVDEKLALAARESSTGDTLKVAVLAALNIADELFRARSAEGTVNTHWCRKAEELERLVDDVIGVARSAS